MNNLYVYMVIIIICNVIIFTFSMVNIILSVIRLTRHANSKYTLRISKEFAQEIIEELKKNEASN